MDIGIVILIIFGNLASVALGAYAMYLGVNTSFLDAKGFPLPPLKKKSPNKNNGKSDEEIKNETTQKYEAV